MTCLFPNIILSFYRISYIDFTIFYRNWTLYFAGVAVGCGTIDREEGWRGGQGGTIKHMWHCDSDESIHYTQSQVIWEQACRLLVNISKTRIVLELEHFKFTFYRVNEILMFWCCQSVTVSQSQVRQFNSSGGSC